MRRALCLALVVAGLAPARLAEASDHVARFVYLRGKGTENCPDEMDVRQAVIGRLGYDPFRSFAAATMFTEVAVDGTGFSANLKLVDGDNSVRGDRVLKTRGECRELMEAMALTISIAIDPESTTREGPPPEAPPAERPVAMLPAISKEPEEPAPAPMTETRDDVREPAPARTPLALNASLGPLLSTGSAPSVAFGGALSVDAHHGLFFGGVEGRADAPASSGNVTSSLVMGSFFAGLRRGIVFVAAVGGLGSVLATSRDISVEKDAAALVATAGLRAGVAVPLTSWLELRGRVEALGNLARHRLQINQTTAYVYPAVSGNLSAALAVRFW